MSYVLKNEQDAANRAAMLGKLGNARDNLESAYSSWDALAAGQKDQALKPTEPSSSASCK